MLFAFVWVGGLAIAMTGCAFQRSEMLKQLAVTPEYQCLLRAMVKAPYVAWDSVGTRRHTKGGPTTATIKDRKTTDCIPGGDAVTYVALPVINGEKDVLVRFPGKDVTSEYGRSEEWYELVNVDGSVRYRNDGAGYYQVGQ